MVTFVEAVTAKSCGRVGQNEMVLMFEFSWWFTGLRNFFQNFPSGVSRSTRGGTRLRPTLV